MRFPPVRVIFLFAILVLTGICEARPEFVPIFKNYYKPDASSALGQATCGICHTSPPKRNPYGKDLKKLVDASPEGMLTVDMLKQVEGLDSAGNGSTNGEKIKQGLMPGEATSKPSPGDSPAGGTPDASQSLIQRFIPTNGYHPVVIHFPIALFIFGLFLEFVGLRRKNPALGVAALWNLAGALASLVLVAPTGIAAWLVGGHKLEGTMLIHLLLAITSLTAMSTTLIARKKLGNTSKAYWAILLIAAVVIGFTGYFGGILVYG